MLFETDFLEGGAVFNSLLLFSLLLLWPILLVQTAGLFWLAVRIAKPEKLTRVRAIVWVLVWSSVQVLWCDVALMAGWGMGEGSLVIGFGLMVFVFLLACVWALWCRQLRSLGAASLSIVFAPVLLAAEVLVLSIGFFTISTTSAGGYVRIGSPVETWVVSRRRNVERWDLIAHEVFTYRRDIEVGRLVGLPGEQIEITNGQLSVNGVHIDPPARRSNVLVYPNSAVFYSRENWSDQVPATADFDVTLAGDEYFVLGHGVAHVNDSRYWLELNGGEGFGVNAKDVRGVVRMITWPNERFRVFW